jgi:hypothetical protein
MALIVGSSTVQDCRNAYKIQSKDKILNLLEKLEDKASKTNDEKCYEAVFLCLKADYSSNPYTKLSSFNSGYKKLNALIAKNSANVEYRYHRFMIETKAPSFLIDDSHVSADRKFVKTNLKKSNPLYSIIIKTIDK